MYLVIDVCCTDRAWDIWEGSVLRVVRTDHLWNLEPMRLALVERFRESFLLDRKSTYNWKIF